MKFQTIYFELVDSTEMIRSLLAGISQEEARIRSRKEAWSILETLCHLLDEECEDFRPRLGYILGRKFEKWQAIDPEAWVIERKYNEQNFPDVKERFFSERSKSLDWLKGIESANLELSYRADFGDITAGNILASWIAHDNLHVRQLVELRRARIEMIAEPYNTKYAGEW